MILIFVPSVSKDGNDSGRWNRVKRSMTKKKTRAVRTAGSNEAIISSNKRENGRKTDSYYH